MKTYIYKFIFLIFPLSIYSQNIPSIQAGNDKLGITSLDIKVEVVGNVATTTYDMLFYNPTKQVLEGELAFPLGEGQRVSRLALEVNGKLREAVVVAKEQGRVAFEAVVRRRVDPVLLEKGTGNNYKARIYPIPARGHKRIVLAYEQELILSEESHYFHLPLGFKKSLDFFALEMNVFDQKLKPSLEKGNIENFQFNALYNNFYAKTEKKNYVPSESLTIKIPQYYSNEKTIVFDDYFYVYKALKANKKLREKPDTITIYWDASLSMKSRDIDKELEFLDTYFKYLKDVKVELLKFSNQVISSKNYKISNGNWKILKASLINTVYDGGTSYANLFLNNTSQEILLFSDGMKNLSDLAVNTSQPIYVVNSLVKANHSELNTICEATNGKYINLKKASVNESVDKIRYQSFKFLGYKTSNKEAEIYPNKPTTVSTDFSFSGKNFNPNDIVVLLFGYGNKVIQKDSILIKPNVTNSLVKRIWAQKKLNELQKNSNKNKDEIIKHSTTYSLVSNYTSLIVLETVWDYVRYKITPPEELLVEYNRIINRNNGKKVVSVQENEVQERQITATSNSGNISGTVVDASGLALPGVNIIVKGTTTGTQTDFDGNYRINAVQGADLVFSYIGMQTLETTIGNSSIVNISMQEDSAHLDEVVVVGYGTQKRQSLTGAVSVIKTEEIGNRGYTTIAQALQGKVAGVQINSASGQPGASSNIVIRGVNSFNGNNQPLFVVDGIPVNGNIDDLISVNDIESITVLKGASAGALYGSRAANGVIIVTSKSNNRVSHSRDYRSENWRNKKNKYRGRLKVKTNLVNESYINELEESKTASEAYGIYLSQRDEHGHLPAYYIDVYDYFKKWNNESIELRILTNIAELDFDNYELLRVLGYKLEERNNYGLASFIYAQVLKLRPEDSQSYRDLALAYQEIGLAQESFNLLNSIVSESIYKDNDRRRFHGMQSIAKNEINKVIQSNPKLDKSQLNESKEINTSYDVRIVIDWNHNDTDIDLHIIDPNLEECYYSHSKTQIGGQLSQDMTQGFGPEEFTLKYAKEGIYFIKVNYYGDRYQKIENPTFMKVTMFKNFGKPNETKDIKIVRLTKAKDKQIVAKLEV